MNDIDEPAVFGSKGESGAKDFPVGLEAKIQTDGVSRSTDETGLGVRQLSKVHRARVYQRM